MGCSEVNVMRVECPGLYEFRYRLVAEALYEALKDDPFYITLERSIGEGDAKVGMLKYLDYSICESEASGCLYLSSEPGSGASIWSRPLSGAAYAEKGKAKEQFILEHLGASSLAVYGRVVGGMSEKTGSVIEPEFWYLSILGVLPALQGMGLGKTLIEPVLSQSDALNVSTYLETFTPRNKSFYQRLGYVEVGVFFEPTVNAEYAVMVRAPRGVLA